MYEILEFLQFEILILPEHGGTRGALQNHRQGQPGAPSPAPDLRTRAKYLPLDQHEIVVLCVSN